MNYVLYDALDTISCGELQSYTMISNTNESVEELCSFPLKKIFELLEPNSCRHRPWIKLDKYFISDNFGHLFRKTDIVSNKRKKSIF